MYADYSRGYWFISELNICGWPAAAAVEVGNTSIGQERSATPLPGARERRGPAT